MKALTIVFFLMAVGKQDEQFISHTVIDSPFQTEASCEAAKTVVAAKWPGAALICMPREIKE